MIVFEYHIKSITSVTEELEVNAVIRISVDRPSIPPGMVMLEDVAPLSQGLHDALARLIQRQLGFSGRRRFPEEVRRLTSVALSAVTRGSGNMECGVLPVEGIYGRPPSIVAAFDLVNGIRTFQDSGRWPEYLPAKIRNRIGAAIAPVLSRGIGVSFSVQENGSSSRCVFSQDVRTALQESEVFEAEDPVEIVGTIYEINTDAKQFKIAADSKKVTVRYPDDQFREIDRLRWKRILLKAYPVDERCRTVARLEEIRMAQDDEEDGVFNPKEIRRGERTGAYQAAFEKAVTLRTLRKGWDSYQAAPPDHRSIEWALSFLRDAAGVLLDYEIEPPIPFMVATPAGGVQFEWSADGRDLELEIPRPGDFRYYASEHGVTREGAATRWEAIRLIRWAATGEAV